MVGNCIGERNKGKFYAYIWIQAIQLLVGVTLTSLVLDKIMVKESKEKLDRFFALYFGMEILICALFLLFVSALLVLHTYLIGQGLTSWEYFSWMKITYMKVWPRKYGSPFSQGSFIDNFKDYFSPINQYSAIQWKMPSSLPKI